jgi:hypothetical protein
MQRKDFLESGKNLPKLEEIFFHPGKKFSKRLGENTT